MRIMGRRFGSGLTPVVAWVLGIQIGFFVLFVLCSKATQAQLTGWLALTGADLLRGHIWRLATTLLLNESPLSLVFDALLLALFVPTMERFWGARRFVVFLVTVALAGNVLGALVGLLAGPHTPIVGLAPTLFACIAAFGVVYGQQEVRFFGAIPIKGRAFAIGMMVFVAVFVLLEKRWVYGASVVGAVGTAVLVARGGFSPRLWWLQAQHRRLKSRLGVIDGGKKGPHGSSGSGPDRWVN